MRVVRQACAGLVWSKQIYPYDVSAGSTATQRRLRRRRDADAAGTPDWRHLDSFDVLAMPDPWEYPWFAAWDLAFHAIPWAHLDPAFAKYQLTVLLREWFLHPNGALPAYEWNFDDVNPPVHALAAIRVFVIDGSTDTDFLERVFQKLLLNFTWWVNRQDPDGNNLFGGGFLGLDNISPVDRSNLPPGLRIEQADGTAWMAYYSLAMLVLARTLAERNPVYDDMVVKFLEHFVLISDALGDVRAVRPRRRVLLRPAHRRATATPPRSRSSRSSACSRCCRRPRCRSRSRSGRQRCASGSRRRLERSDATAAGRGRSPARATRGGCSSRWSRPASSRGWSRRCSTRRPSSRRTACGRCPSGTRRRTSSPACPDAGIDYQPAESGPSMYGGNSNWRGPVWFPTNYLVIRALLQYDQFFGGDFTVEYPTGSGRSCPLREVAGDLADRLVVDLAARRRRPASGVRRSGRPRPTRRGGTTCCSSSTSTATTAPGSAPPTRPAGPRWSPTSSSTRPGRRA